MYTVHHRQAVTTAMDTEYDGHNLSPLARESTDGSGGTRRPRGWDPSRRGSFHLLRPPVKQGMPHARQRMRVSPITSGQDSNTVHVTKLLLATLLQRPRCIIALSISVLSRRRKHWMHTPETTRDSLSDSLRCCLA